MILLGCRKISVAAAGLLTFGIDRGGGKNHFLVRANRRKVPKKISNTKIVSDILFFSAFFFFCLYVVFQLEILFYCEKRPAAKETSCRRSLAIMTLPSGRVGPKAEEQLSTGGYKEWLCWPWRCIQSLVPHSEATKFTPLYSTQLFPPTNTLTRNVAMNSFSVVSNTRSRRPQDPRPQSRLNLDASGLHPLRDLERIALSDRKRCNWISKKLQ